MNRKPDYRLKFLNKETEEKGELGGAWLNKDGSITLVLDPKVCLMQDRHEVLTLFPQPVPKSGIPHVAMPPPLKEASDA